MSVRSNLVRSVVAVALSGLLVAGCSSGSDDGEGGANVDSESPFFDDFSTDTTQFGSSLRLSDTAEGGVTYGDGFAVSSVTSTGTEREGVRFTTRGNPDTWYAVMSLEPDSVVSGESRAYARLSWAGYSDTDNDNCIGDFNFYLRIRAEADQDLRFEYGAWRHTEENCNDGADAPVLDGESFMVVPDLTPEYGVSYRLEISIDRELGQLTIGIDDQRYNYALPAPGYPAGQPFYHAEARVERGPGTSAVRFDEIGTEDYSVDFSQTDNLFRYTLWDAGKSGQTNEVTNGELRLESVSSGDRSENRLGITGFETQFAQAQMRLSSNSVATDGGSALARVGGSMFYAAESPTNDGALDQVFAVTQIVHKEDGTNVAEYCAWQSLNNDFSSDVSLTNPESDSGCNVFQLVPELDRNYTMATWMDKANNRIVFSIDDEVQYLPIESATSYDSNLFSMRVQSRAAGNGSRAEVFVDDLRMDPSIAL